MPGSLDESRSRSCHHSLLTPSAPCGASPRAQARSRTWGPPGQQAIPRFAVGTTKASPEFKAAAGSANWNGTPGFGVVLTNEAGAGSWPIAGATFILMHKQPKDPAAATEALRFFAWAYAKGDKMAEDLDYVPMPDNVVNAIQKLWAAQIKDGLLRVGKIARHSLEHRRQVRRAGSGCLDRIVRCSLSQWRRLLGCHIGCSRLSGRHSRRDLGSFLR